MTAPAPLPAVHKARLAFLGVGWIGRNRMEAILKDGAAEAVAVSDVSGEMAAGAQALAPAAAVVDSLEALIDAGPDGVVIATPSALHAAQSIRALQAGIAVFCQKPLGRNAAETAAVIAAARDADRLLGVDFSYRHTDAMQAIRRRLEAGEIGQVYAADLVFHNAYGPDKAWFYDPVLAGGGCVMDLGVHLVDLMLWCLDFPKVADISADLFAQGARLASRSGQVEDYAVATLELDGGTVVRIACSWRLNAGRDAEISAVFHGTAGSLAFTNCGGSFYDFAAELRCGTRRQVLVSPPDDWSGRAAVAWARRLAADCRFDPEAERFRQVSKVIDGIYASARGGQKRYQNRRMIG